MESILILLSPQASHYLHSFSDLIVVILQLGVCFLTPYQHIN